MANRDVECDEHHLVWDCPNFEEERTKALDALDQQLRPTSFEAWCPPEGERDERVAVLSGLLSYVSETELDMHICVVPPRRDYSCTGVMSKFGALDIVVNNAGIFSEDNWRKMFAINIGSVYSGILLGFKYMGKDKGYNGGHIINTASIVGIYVTPPAPAYNTSKCAVVTMTRVFGILALQICDRALYGSVVELPSFVALLDIDEKQGTKTVAEFQQKHGKESCVFYECDVTNEGQLEDCFKSTRSKFGALDILVNNAGIFSEDNWRKMFAINIESVYSGILLGFKYMGKDKGYNGGHIINTASIVGIYVAPAAPAYNTSKCAVVAMTRAFGSKLHLDRHGVKVNCLCPDPIDTSMWAQITDHLSSDKGTVGTLNVFSPRVQQ
ncbi:hypothetical protein HPB47_012904 [Ixodes persulcatus]|uniref:Uncharacterized protein n=1 Tax=Ixodes persulcatus TaxID=34615 RepID=A0AC60NSF0_IXOPE|nr:hypothetical protein HPB47_012904 [Ixodes persulcatus]